MGSSSSSVIETVEKLAKSVGDGIKSIKLPDNPLKDVSLGNKGRNFLKGVSSGIRGPKQVRVQVNTGPFGLGRTTQLRSVSRPPLTVSGLAGDFVGHEIGLIGSTGSKPSLFNRIKKKIKPTNIELSNMSEQSKQPQSQQPQQPQQSQQPQSQQPQQSQQAGKKKKSSKKETTRSKREKKPSKKETTSHKKEKKPSENKKNPK